MAREVRVAILGDSRDFSRAVRSAEADAGRLGNMGGKLAAFGKTAALGLAGAGVAAGAFAKSAIDAGSDLNETLSKSNTVFGTQAKAIETWANGAAKGFGQSKKQALEAASSFGNMFSQLGIGDRQAADMSRSMTELASDFASFHNADISEVIEAQSAAFRGEYDSVQKFVPTINAAAVEQKALKMGLAKTTKELDAQDKAIAVQALLMEGAGDAAGDFARTSDGLANKQRILSARFEDVKAKIGQGLIPIALKLASFITDKVIPAFEKWGPKVAAFVTSVVAVVQKNWPQIQATITQVITTVRGIIEGFVSVITTLWNNFGDNILSFVQRVWPRIQQVIEGALKIIRGVITTVTALIRGDWSQVWEGIKQIVSGAWSAIQGIVGTALELLRSAVGVGLEVLGSIVKGAFDGIIGLVAGMPGRIASFASTMWDSVKRAATAAKDWVLRKIDQMLGPIDEVLGKLSKIGGGLVGGGQADIRRGLDSRAQGGMVAGALGQPRLILAHGGEQVLTHGQQLRAGGGPGGSIVIQITTAADPQAVVEAVSRYVRTNGQPGWNR